jgi:hypothetical protein
LPAAKAGKTIAYLPEKNENEKAESRISGIDISFIV